MSNRCPILPTCLLSSYCRSINANSTSFPTFENYKKGQRINANTDKTTYVIVSGIGKATFSLGCNEILDIILLGKKQVFGEHLPFIQERISVEFWALTDICVCKIPSAGLRKYARQNSLLLFDIVKASGSNYSASLSIRWIKNAPKLFEQTLRLLIVINAISAEYPQDPIRLTHDDIALILNADRSSVSLALEKLRQEGIVEIGYRKICLKDSFAYHKLKQELKSISETTYSL